MQNASITANSAQKLSNFNFNSVEWQKIEEYISARKQELSIQLVLADENIGQANIIRGRIRELDDLLSARTKAFRPPVPTESKPNLYD